MPVKLQQEFIALGKKPKPLKSSPLYKKVAQSVNTGNFTDHLFANSTAFTQNWVDTAQTNFHGQAWKACLF